jgi:1-acyl-sn-glycerol-3-phosphate acyltransferase
MLEEAANGTLPYDALNAPATEEECQDAPAGGALCMAVTRAGQPCKNHPLPGSLYCRVHQVTEAQEAPPAAAPETLQAGEGTTAGDIPEPAAADVADDALRRQLAGELDQLISRMQAKTPGYTPPPFSPRHLIGLIEENLDKLTPEVGLSMLQRLRNTLTQDVLDIETWKGIWYVLNYALQYEAGVLKRRMTGDYEVDPWGLDWEFLDTVKPFFEFMYKIYWRVDTNGLENVPVAGRGLLVSNHSGQLPWDGAMLATAMLTQHPAQRLVRTLYGAWFPTLPFLSSLFVKCGQVLGTVDNGIRLLQQDELVAVFPEGYKGVGKLFRERYRLARFGRGGFVKMALTTNTPIIPVSVVGAEETYISLSKSGAMAKLIHFPYFPISPTFPWLGLLGFVPLPTKWYIDIGEPIPVDHYGPGAAENPMLISQLTDQVRNVVQQMIYTRLAKRESVFLG